MDGDWDAVYADQYHRLVVLIGAVAGALAPAEKAVGQAFVHAGGVLGRRRVPADPQRWIYHDALRRLGLRNRRLPWGRRPPVPLSGQAAVEEPAGLASLARLPVAEREALALRHLARLPDDVVAAWSGVGVGTVLDRLERAETALARLSTPGAPVDPSSAPAPGRPAAGLTVSGLTVTGPGTPRARAAPAHAATGVVTPAAFFATLDDQLARQLTPDLRRLHAARQRHGRRLVAGAVVALLGVVLLAAVVHNRTATTAAAPHPAVTGSRTAAPSASSPPADVPTIARMGGPVVGQGGVLFALICDCSTDQQQGAQSWRIGRSIDLGLHWDQLSVVGWLGRDAAPRLLGGADGRLWIVDGARGDIAFSEDSGLTFRRFTSLTTQPDLVSLAPDATVLWAYSATGYARLDPLTDAPQQGLWPWPGDIVGFAALGRDSVLVHLSDGAQSRWYRTTDAGVTWPQVPDPCAGTPHAGTRATTMSVTTAGFPVAVWVQCQSAGGGDGLASYVSGTDGRHWQRRGPDGTQDASALAAFSATQAWRFGDPGMAYVMSDGSHWRSVPPPLRGDAQSCVAVDPRRASCVDYVDLQPTRLHRTTDAGGSWTDTPWSG